MLDRDRLEAVLDRLLAARDRMVRAEPCACGSSGVRDKLQNASQAHDEARAAFVAEVVESLPPPPSLASPPAVVVPGEEQRTRGRPYIWRRWVEIKIGWCGAVYTFTADAESLTLDTGAVEAGDDAELRASDFDPLCEGHTVRFHGIDYTATDPGPPDLVRLAIEACREVALRLHANGLDHFAARRDWPAHLLAFDELVRRAPHQSAA